MTEHEFNNLLERYQQGKATDKEKLALEKWLEQRSTGNPFGRLSATEKEKIRMAMLTQVNEKLRADKHITTTRNIPAYTIPFQTVYRIAASLLLMAVVGYGAYQLWQPTETVASLPVQTDFVAGGDKAVLKLADGTQIELDEKGSTTIPQQGVAKVVSESGKLSYLASAASAREASPLYNSISTPRGGQYQLTLADGSKVWLNAASTLRFPAVFAGAERMVELTGEAYFEIAQNKKMPFKVRIPSGAEVEVLGTHFNVMAYAEEKTIKTTLLEGAVKISSATSPSPLERAGVRLSPNQQAQITQQGSLSIIKDYDVSEAVAWKNNKFIFKDTDLEAIMYQVARWYDVEVIFEDDVRDLQFGGVISRKENASAVLQLLELTGAVNFEMEGRKINEQAFF
jgi:transmembrane sensor